MLQRRVKLLIDYIKDGIELRQKIDFPDEFTCTNCLKFLYKPSTASCGHSFCEKCTLVATTCRHCHKVLEAASFSKTNVKLNNVIELCYPKECSYRSLIKESDELYNKKSFQDAANKYSVAIKLVPNRIDAICKRAMAHKDYGDWDHAQKDIVRLKIRLKYFSTTHYNEENLQQTIERENEIIQKVIVHFQNEIANQVGMSVTYTAAELEAILDTVINSHCVQPDDEDQHSDIIFDKGPKAISEDDNDFDDMFCCILCTTLVYDPVCTPCGHLFCSECLHRSSDRRPACPMCQASLKEVFQYENCLIPIDRTMDSIIRKYLPECLKEREEMGQEEREKYKATLPLFVCTLAFPSVPLQLHIFEPRYRVLLRRALKYNDGKFGITASSNTVPFYNVGTVLDIKKTSFYVCGRSLVSSVGGRRFEVIQNEACDGYIAAKIEYITDEQETELEEIEGTKKMATVVYEKIKTWYESGPETFRQHIEAQIGKFPEQDFTQGENGPNWIWWGLAMSPVNNDLKVHVLEKRIVRQRLYCLNSIFDNAQWT